jgi:UDP-N-acetyl-D-mannosaminuronate dehydrogenase
MGLGYIGLPTVTIVESQGISVIGVDANPQVVKAVNLVSTRKATAARLLKWAIKLLFAFNLGDNGAFAQYTLIK